MTNGIDTTYNGWKNRATWNVVLWLSNDEGLYSLSQEHDTYESLRDTLRELGTIETPDGVAFNDSGLDIDAITEAITEV